MKKALSLVVALMVAGCGEPTVLSPDNAPSATSTSLQTEQPTTSFTVSSTTTTLSVSNVEFPVMELIDPDTARGGSIDPGFNTERLFDLGTVAGFDSNRTEALLDFGDRGSFRIWSETAGPITQIRVETSLPEEGSRPTEWDEQSPGEWIVTPKGVWVLTSNEWVRLDPSDIENAWLLAIAPWQLSAPLNVYALVYNLFSDLEPQRWESFDEREVVVYVGDVDAVAKYWGEQSGDVVTGSIEVWMDPAGFPVKVDTSASQILDLSIPPTSEWLLRDLGAAIEIQLPERIDNSDS